METRAENLERAIHYYREALQVRTSRDFPLDWAETQTNLANAYIKRLRGDRAENIEQARVYYQEVLQVYTRAAHPAEWAIVQFNLAAAYLMRLRGERSANIEQAIQHGQAALTVFAAEGLSGDWAAAQNVLAVAYAERVEGELAENIEQAINSCREALRIRTRRASPLEWAESQVNLANAYFKRQKGQRADNIERTIHAFNQALKIKTHHTHAADWAMIHGNLAQAFAERIVGQRVENMAQAADHTRQSLKVYTPDTDPANCRLMAIRLAGFYFDAARWAEAAAAFEIAHRAQRELTHAALSRSRQETELAFASNLHGYWAYALARAGQPEQAALALEKGRAQLLSDALESNRRELERLAEIGQEALYRQYQEVKSAYDAVQDRRVGHMATLAAEEGQLEKGERLRKELDELVAAIRQQPGWEDFKAEPTLTHLQTASRAAPLVYLAVTQVGGLALVVQDGRVIPTWLDTLTNEALTTLMGGPEPEQLGGYLGAYVAWREIHYVDAFERWQEKISEALRWAWDHVMGPVIEYLADSGAEEAVLIPGGLLGLLPLSAAWIEDPNRPMGRRYALDHLTFRYAPNARALLAATDVATRIETETLLIIDNPDNSLKFAANEVKAAKAYFENSHRLSGREATHQVVGQALPFHTVYHFATHGQAGWQNPLSGYLTLADGRLTLEEIYHLALPGARLAVLSACETGISGTNVPDEIIGLPSGLLQAGTAGIIASQWAVADVSTAILMARFYGLWKEEALPPARALRAAQIWLRSSTNQQIQEFFEQAWSPAESEGHSAALENLMGSLHSHYEGARDFSAPFHWAAFTFTGV